VSKPKKTVVYKKQRMLFVSEKKRKEKKRLAKGEDNNPVKS